MAIIAMKWHGVEEAASEAQANAPYPRALRGGLISYRVRYYAIMRGPAIELPQKALALSDEERAELAASLIDSLDTSVDAGAESEWNREIACRVEDLDSGKAKTVPWGEVRRRISTKIKLGQ